MAIFHCYVSSPEGTWEWEFANLQPQFANLKFLQLDAQKKKQRSAAPQNVLIIPSLLNVWLAFKLATFRPWNILKQWVNNG